MLIWSLVLLMLLVAAGLVVAWRFDAEIERDCNKVRETPAATVPGATLPPLLEAYVARAALPASGAMRWSRIEQEGEMRMKPGDEWRSFDAAQVYAVAEPSFVWKASFKAFKVVDSVVQGDGRLEARVLGVLPVARASGAVTTQAQLLRYLAEIVWVPRAISSNRFISWRQTSDTEVIGTLEYSGERVDLRLLFDVNGDIRRIEGIRECAVEGQRGPAPWVGEFSDYKKVGGVRIPTHGEVQWILESGPFTYWRGTVTKLETK